MPDERPDSTRPEIGAPDQGPAGRDGVEGSSPVAHVPAERRFVVRLASGEAELTYVERKGRVLDLVHTYVPPEARGEGIGEDLVEGAFAYARGNGYRVRPSCPFVRDWLEDHPEHADLVEPRSQHDRR